MDNLVSSWADGITLPENYVFPPGKRPGKYVIPSSKTVPVIDLSKAQKDDHTSIVHQIMEAAQGFGFFQVINHGVPSELVEKTMAVFKELFDLLSEEKSNINMTEDTTGSCKLYTSSYNYETEETHYWRDALRHSCSPLEESINYWPHKPENYKKIVEAYVIGVKDMGSRILELVSQGLRLERGYFANGLSEDDFLTVNHYPPCPDPSLTLGLSPHSDPNLITILRPGHVPGLQVFKDGQWMGFETLPNAFVVIVGNQLQIVSNGKLKSAVHRAVTNANEARISAAFFINPSMDCIVQPAKPLLQTVAPLYKAFQYKDFFTAYIGLQDTETVFEAFKITA